MIIDEEENCQWNLVSLSPVAVTDRVPTTLQQRRFDVLTPHSSLLTPHSSLLTPHSPPFNRNRFRRG